MHTRLLACLLAACGSNGTSPDASTDAHPDASPDAPGSMTSGLVTIARLHDAGGTPLLSTTSAQFVSGSSIFGTTIGSDGGCTMLENPPTVGISAGVIDLTGTTSPITLTPSGSPSKYTSSTVPTDAFAAGAQLTFTAAGADVPAFSATITAPDVLIGFATPTTISRAAGFHATWTPGTGQGMWLLIVGKPANDAFLLLCRMPDNGSFTVTPAALAMFPAAATGVAVTLIRVGEHHLAVANGAVDLEVFDGIVGSGTTMLNP
jgi:hypothetical protein